MPQCGLALKTAGCAAARWQEPAQHHKPLSRHCQHEDAACGTRHIPRMQGLDSRSAAAQPFRPPEHRADQASPRGCRPLIHLLCSTRCSPLREAHEAALEDSVSADDSSPRFHHHHHHHHRSRLHRHRHHRGRQSRRTEAAASAAAELAAGLANDDVDSDGPCAPTTA